MSLVSVHQKIFASLRTALAFGAVPLLLFAVPVLGDDGVSLTSPMTESRISTSRSTT